MPLEWQPEYPDLLTRDRDLPAAYMPYYGAAPAILLPQWRPRVVDRLPPKSRHAALSAFNVKNFVPIATLPPTPLSWQGDYPDLVFRRPRRDAGAAPMFFGQMVPPAAPVVPLSWKATYPDKTWPKSRSILTTADVTFVGALVIAPYLAWEPEYPDRIARTRLPAGAAQPATLPLISPSPFDVPPLGWQAKYPDEIPPKVSLRVSGQQASAYGTLDPIKNPPPSLGGLIPTYPATVPTKTTIRTSSQQAFVSNLDPIVNPPAPTTGWWPQAPTQIARRPDLRHVTFGSRLVSVPVPAILVSMNWQTQLPDVVHRLTAPRPLPTYPHSGIIEVPVVDSWRPVAPAVLFRRVWPMPDLTAQWFPTPTVIPNNPDCVSFTSETVTQLTMSEETLETFSDLRMAEESVTGLTMAEEDLC